jgi:SnoaL-like domain
MDSDLETVGAIELTRRLFVSANSRDFDAMMSFFGPLSVWDVNPWGLGTHTGLAAIRRFLEGWIGSFQEYRVVVEGLAELSHDVVLVTATQYAHAAQSPAILTLPYAPVVVWLVESQR